VSRNTLYKLLNEEQPVTLDIALRLCESAGRRAGHSHRGRERRDEGQSGGREKAVPAMEQDIARLRDKLTKRGLELN